MDSRRYRDIIDIARVKTLTRINTDERGSHAGEGACRSTIAKTSGEEKVNGIPPETKNPLARKPLYLLGKTGFEHRRKDKIPELPW